MKPMCLKRNDLISILESHLPTTNRKVAAKPAARAKPDEFSKIDWTGKSQLQSVQEESEVSDSSAEKRSAKQTIKPSKRSRFE
jgi:hypothetical protein